ncbi:MAG: DUF5683 domain-containing protein [Candidatus Eisenbacteria bacterium]
MTWRAGQRAVALTAVLAMLSPAAAAAAGESVPEGVPGEADRPSGATAMIASAAYPGLGQLMNGTEPKAAIVSAVEAFLVAGIIVEDRRARNSLRLYKQTNSDRHYDDYSEHFDRRQTLVWWAAVAVLYGLADAYVDAHLAGFEAGSTPRVESSFGGEGGEFRLGLAFRF